MWAWRPTGTCGSACVDAGIGTKTHTHTHTQSNEAVIDHDCTSRSLHAVPICAVYTPVCLCVCVRVYVCSEQRVTSHSLVRADDRVALQPEEGEGPRDDHVYSALFPELAAC